MAGLFLSTECGIRPASPVTSPREQVRSYRRSPNLLERGLPAKNDDAICLTNRIN